MAKENWVKFTGGNGYRYKTDKNWMLFGMGDNKWMLGRERQKESWKCKSESPPFDWAEEIITENTK